MVIKNKKGISVMIGYIFLITITIIISTIVYQQLRTYVPTEAIECPEGVSVFLKEVSYDCDNKELNITLKNNGRFSVAGYFITATDSPEKELATIDLSEYNEFGKGGAIILDVLSENSMSPNKEVKSVFDLSDSSYAQFYSLNIIPIRYQEIENRNRLVSCGDSRIKQTLMCIEVCIPNTCSGLGYACGDWSDGCGGVITCEACTDPDVCDSTGQCIPPAECTDTCSSFGYQCGTQTICGVETDCSAEVGGCAAGLTCDTAGQCISSCGNGVIDSGEECDDGNTLDDDGCSNACTIESNFVCSGEPSVCEENVLGTELSYFGFESGNQGWTDPGADSERSDVRSKVYDNGAGGGNWSWKINENSAESYTSENFNFVGYSQIKIEWWGYYTNLENKHNDCVELKIDNIKVESWGSNPTDCDNEINQDQWIAQEVILNSTDYNFDSSVEVRFEGEMNNENDEFYIDGIRITGIG